MHSRLTEYFCETSAESVQRYTGDHHDFRNPKQRFTLLATPEALDSLQLMHPDMLRHIRAVICDELHLLHGTPRGQQLRHVIARIKSRTSPPPDHRDNFQFVGMTATLEDQANAAALWGGKDCVTISAGEPRPIDLEIFDVATVEARCVAEKIRECDHHKYLVFANTRNQAHEFVSELDHELGTSGWPLFMHIGIIGRAERERVEHEMKYGTRGICVATSTLEVGIDIGDVDVVVLLKPPMSISSFLQRIGRGNRRTGECRVWALARSGNDRQMYEALVRCARSGVMDDAHDFSRPSVEFQQAASIIWAGVRAGQNIDIAEVIRRSGSTLEAKTIYDMLTTGVAREIGKAIVLNDEWMDLGDLRRLHSTIASTGGLPIIDIESGEVIATGDRDLTVGRLYAGSRVSVTAGADDKGVYAKPGQNQPKGPLAKLPAARRGIVGLSRQLVWATAEASGVDPAIWCRSGAKLYTWGGDKFNVIIAEALRCGKITSDAKPYSDHIDNIPPSLSITPSSVKRLVEDMHQRSLLRYGVAKKFRQPSQFLSVLSPQRQRDEALQSVPFSSLYRWLGSCKEQIAP